MLVIEKLGGRGLWDAWSAVLWLHVHHDCGDAIISAEISFACNHLHVPFCPIDRLSRSFQPNFGIFL